MSVNTRPKEITPSTPLLERMKAGLYDKNFGSVDLPTFYGLRKDVKFCTNCVISNQRPNSAVEFAHKISSKKKTIKFDKNNVCDAWEYILNKVTICYYLV